MAPRSFANPAPITAAAKQDRKAFFCDLCQKGYSRQNEFDAHQSSYEHNHKRRFKDLQALNRNMGSQPSEKAKDKNGGGMIKINPIGGDAKKETGARGGFKKSGFTSLVQTVGDDGLVREEVVKKIVEDTADGSVKAVEADELESDTDEEGYEVYDPKRPTGCEAAGCTATA